MANVCSECNQEYDDQWCKPCISIRFKNDFSKWTSGNGTIDKFIQDTQLNADIWKLTEWIPYDRFQEIKQIAKGGYGTIYYAKWVDGCINDWDIENQQWKRYEEQEVALKRFDGIVDINEDFLNEMAILSRTNKYEGGSLISTLLLGITKDPETHKYMMVLTYYSGGSLRNYLNNNFNDIDWFDKLTLLKDLASKFSVIHELDIVHRDFHPGNILKYSLNDNYIYISDFGLSKLITSNIKNPQKNTISGVLPYIAPEVLNGEEYKKAADVYSFAFVAYEMITGLPPYHDVPHDKELAFKICNGFRPQIPFHTPKLITQMIMRCWDARTTHRPTFEELHKELDKYWKDYRENGKNNNNEITIQIKEASEFSKNQTTSTTTTTTPLNYKTHPQAIYTSRLLNFSSLPLAKNASNFEKKLSELTSSFYQINGSDEGDDLDTSNYL